MTFQIVFTLEDAAQSEEHRLIFHNIFKAIPGILGVSNL